MRTLAVVVIMVLAGCAAPSPGHEAPPSEVLRERSVLVYEMFVDGEASGETMRYAFSPSQVVDPYGRIAPGYTLDMETSLDDPIRQLAAERMWLDHCRTPLTYQFPDEAMLWLDMPSDFARGLQPFLATGVRDGPDIAELEEATADDRIAYYDAWTTVSGDGYDVRIARDGDALVGAIGYDEPGKAWTTWVPGLTWFDDAPVPEWFSIGGPKGDVDWRLIEHQAEGEPFEDCDAFTAFEPVQDTLSAGRHATEDSPGIDPPLAWVHEQIRSGMVPEASLFLEQHPDAYIHDWRYNTYPGAYLLEEAESDATWTVRYVYPGADDYMAVHCHVHDEAPQKEAMRCNTSSYSGYDFAHNVSLEDFQLVSYKHWRALCDGLGSELVGYETYLSFWEGERRTVTGLDCGETGFRVIDGETGRLSIML